MIAVLNKLEQAISAGELDAQIQAASDRYLPFASKYRSKGYQEIDGLN